MNARIRAVDAWLIAGLPGDIDTIVAELRSQRERSLAERRQAHRSPRLPSRKALTHIVEGFSAALFPNRLGGHDFSEQGIDYFVGQTLDTALRQLQEQVRRELRYAANVAEVDESGDRAAEITQAFAAQLPELRALLDSDIHAAYEGDPAASSQITAIVGRATVDDGQGHTLFDTGDVRAETTYALAGADPALAEALRGSDALRAAARRLGRLLGARVLGHPAASEDAEGR